MNEQELNATMSVIADPINNVYKLETRADIEEIQRICIILALSASFRFAPPRTKSL